MFSSSKKLHRKYDTMDIHSYFLVLLDQIHTPYSYLMNQLIDQNLRSHYRIQDHIQYYVKKLIKIPVWSRCPLLWFIGVRISVDFHPFIVNSLFRSVICTGDLEDTIDMHDMTPFRTHTIFAASTITSNSMGDAVTATVKFPIVKSKKHQDLNCSYLCYLLLQDLRSDTKQSERQALSYIPEIQLIKLYSSNASIKFYYLNIFHGTY